MFKIYSANPLCNIVGLPILWVSPLELYCLMVACSGIHYYLTVSSIHYYLTVSSIITDQFILQFGFFTCSAYYSDSVVNRNLMKMGLVAIIIILYILLYYYIS